MIASCSCSRLNWRSVNVFTRKSFASTRPWTNFESAHEPAATNITSGTPARAAASMCGSLDRSRIRLTAHGATQRPLKLACMGARARSDPVHVLAFALICCVIFSVGLHIGLHQQSSADASSGRVWVGGATSTRDRAPAYAFPGAASGRVLTVLPSEILPAAPPAVVMAMPSKPLAASAITPAPVPAPAPAPTHPLAVPPPPPGAVARPAASVVAELARPIMPPPRPAPVQPGPTRALTPRESTAHKSLQAALETSRRTPMGPMSTFVANGGKFPVVLLTCNRPDMLRSTLESLMSLPNARAKEDIVVVQDGGDQAVQQVAQSFGVHLKQNKGARGAVPRGLRKKLAALICDQLLSNAQGMRVCGAR